MASPQEVNILDSISSALSGQKLQDFNRIHYGKPDNFRIDVQESSIIYASDNNFDIVAYKFPADPEQIRPPRVVRVGIIQHSIVVPTYSTFDPRQAIFEKIGKILSCAAAENVNIVCLQKCWSVPFDFCTKENKSWSKFAETVEDGPSTQFLRNFAAKHNMVIISPIIEKDDMQDETFWNTAVVIDEEGNVMGKHRANHISKEGYFNESTYFSEGDIRHPVFDTVFGKIAINICYGRHFPLNWIMFGVNGAEIVFNPSASVVGPSECLWPIEARTAAISNNYYTFAINRVGMECFPNEASLEDGEVDHRELAQFHGSSYVTAPDGTCTPSLSRDKDGLLIAQLDLNMGRQIKYKWGFNMTQRLQLYADSLNNAVKELGGPKFKDVLP